MSHIQWWQSFLTSGSKPCKWTVSLPASGSLYVGVSTSETGSHHSTGSNHTIADGGSQAGESLAYISKCTNVRGSTHTSALLVKCKRVNPYKCTSGSHALYSQVPQHIRLLYQSHNNIIIIGGATVIILSTICYCSNFITVLYITKHSCGYNYAKLFSINWLFGCMHHTYNIIVL